MIPAPAVCVHNLAQARLALAAASGRRLVLISGPGAAGYAGIPWWQELIRAATADLPPPAADLLDCADAAGYAMAALRAGQRGLILERATPAFPAVHATAAALGALLLDSRPPCLDLDTPGAARRLAAWLEPATR